MTWLYHFLTEPLVILNRVSGDDQLRELRRRGRLTARLWRGDAVCSIMLPSDGRHDHKYVHLTPRRDWIDMGRKAIEDMKSENPSALAPDTYGFIFEDTTFRNKPRVSWRADDPQCTPGIKAEKFTTQPTTKYEEVLVYGSIDLELAVGLIYKDQNYPISFFWEYF